MRDGSLNDYDFSARRLNSALALWTAPDPMARDFSNINPYVYCAANPIHYTDPSGCEYVFNNITAEDKETIIRILSTGTSGALSFSFDDNVLKAKVNDENKPLEYASSMVFSFVSAKEKTIINIDNNSEALIGDARTKTIDLNDMVALGEEGPVNEFGALIHEMVEQNKIQNSTRTDVSEDEIITNAHVKATNIESAIMGVKFSPVRPIDDKKNTITVRFNSNFFDSSGSFPEEIIFDTENGNIKTRK